MEYIVTRTLLINTIANNEFKGNLRIATNDLNRITILLDPSPKVITILPNYN